MYYTLNIFYLPDSVVGIVVVVLGCTIKIEIKIQFCNDFQYFPIILLVPNNALEITYYLSCK